MQLEVDKIFDGKVTGITKFGAFVEFEEGTTGMVHISEISSDYVKEVSDYLKEGQMVKVKVLKMTDDGKVSLSIKQATQSPQPQNRGRQNQHRNNQNNVRSDQKPSFEDMLSKFKQNSEEKMSDIKRNVDSKRGSYSSRKGSK